VVQDGVIQRDARELFRRMVFNILIDNTDDHEKNHALLVVNPYDIGKLKRVPAYDVLPAHSGQCCQEFICGAGGRDSTLGNALSECGTFGLEPDEAAHEVVADIEVVNSWRSHFVQFGAMASDIEHLAAFIDGDGLLEQRRGFAPALYARADAKGARCARRGPFSDEPR
jgi:serine/threonine-protein kinase HipA